MVWQTLLKQAFRSSTALLQYLGLSPELTVENDFLVLVPQTFVDKMTHGDINCPLLRQVLPVIDEGHIQQGFSNDPLQEADHYAECGMLHKYHGRILILVSGECAVHCRYCFRRHFPYQQHQISPDRWLEIQQYLAQHSDIQEVILSGGDPLLVSNKRLADYLNALAGIPHIKTIRIHTRLPIVLPQRVDAGLLDLLSSTRFRVVMVLHSNHPQELCELTAQAFQSLAQVSVKLFNQTVLLRGINDNPQVLTTLSHRLFEQGVIPYYLHCLDKVQGASHFEVSLDEARHLHQRMQSQLPGYLVPRLVREQAGAAHKSWINV